MCLIPATLEKKADFPAGYRDCRIRLFKYIMFISTTRVMSVVIGTKATFSISFYAGQTSTRAEKLSGMNRMVWI